MTRPRRALALLLAGAATIAATIVAVAQPAAADTGVFQHIRSNYDNKCLAAPDDQLAKLRTCGPEWDQTFELKRLLLTHPSGAFIYWIRPRNTLKCLGIIPGDGLATTDCNDEPNIQWVAITQLNGSLVFVNQAYAWCLTRYNGNPPTVAYGHCSTWTPGVNGTLERQFFVY